MHVEVDQVQWEHPGGGGAGDGTGQMGAPGEGEVGALLGADGGDGGTW